MGARCKQTTIDGNTGELRRNVKAHFDISNNNSILRFKLLKYNFSELLFLFIWYEYSLVKLWQRRLFARDRRRSKFEKNTGRQQQRKLLLQHAPDFTR